MTSVCSSFVLKLVFQNNHKSSSNDVINQVFAIALIRFLLLFSSALSFQLNEGMEKGN